MENVAGCKLRVACCFLYYCLFLMFYLDQSAPNTSGIKKALHCVFLVRAEFDGKCCWLHAAGCVLRAAFYITAFLSVFHLYQNTSNTSGIKNALYCVFLVIAEFDRKSC